MARDEAREVDRKRAATGLARLRSSTRRTSNVFHVLNSTVPVPVLYRNRYHTILTRAALR